MTSQHKDLAMAQIHGAIAFEYANEATREAATGFVSTDVRKLARQTDDDSVWMLVATTPTWFKISGAGEAAVNLRIEVIKGTEGTINAGQVIYVSGFNESEQCAEVELAKADSASTMPAIGILHESITDTASGHAEISGIVSGIDTSSWGVGDNLWVSAGTAGALTDTKPQGTGLIQKMGEVVKSHATLGVMAIFGAGRTNDIPNIPENYFWLGDSNGVPQAQPISSYIGGRKVFFLASFNGIYGDYPVRTVTGTGDVTLACFAPSDFASLISLKLVGICTSGAAGSGKDIDLTSMYHADGESYNQHTESDTTSTYDFTGKAEKGIKIDISTVFTGLAAGDRCGLNADHNSIGGSIHYLGIEMEYNVS